MSKKLCYKDWVISERVYLVYFDVIYVSFQLRLLWPNCVCFGRIAFVELRLSNGRGSAAQAETEARGDYSPVHQRAANHDASVSRYGFALHGMMVERQTERARQVARRALHEDVMIVEGCALCPSDVMLVDRRTSIRVPSTYIYTCIYTSTYTYIHVCISQTAKCQVHIYIHVCMHLHMHIYTYVHHRHTYAYIHVCISHI